VIVDPKQFFGLAFAGFCLLVFCALVLFGIFRLFSRQTNSAAEIDAYLRSDAGNTNSSNVPTTFSTSIHSRGKGLTTVELIIDDPKTQMQKHLGARTTTTKEVEAVSYD
jgi:hypothetical protein